MLRHLPTFIFIVFILELASLIWLGGRVGLLPVLGLTVLDVMIGMSLIRRSGTSIFTALNTRSFAFDWLSRLGADAGGISGLAATANKPVALLASSPGLLGGLRAMNYLRQYLQMAFAMIVVPQQFALARAHEAFDDAGTLKDAKAAQVVSAVLSSLKRLAATLPAA